MTAANTPATGSLRSLLRGHRGRFFAALLLAEFGGAMLGIAYSTVLPVVARALDGFALFGATLSGAMIASVLMLSVAAAILSRVRPGRVLFVATLGSLLGALMSAAAPTMEWVLAGTLVRGAASGLILGFGAGALGALYDEHERPRVFGVFAIMWLLPSVAGPLVNAAVAKWIGWRWALAWPAVFVLAGRLLMGRYVDAVPWQRSNAPAHPVPGLAITVGLVIGGLGSAGTGPWSMAALVAGLAVAGVAIGVFLVRAARGGPLARVAFALTLTCITYFGVSELLSLTMIEALGHDVLWGAVPIVGAMLAWSLVSLRPAPDARPDRVLLGALLIALGLAGTIVTLALASATVAIAGIVTAATVMGIGMGMAYPLLNSEPFSVAGEVSATEVGALTGFAESAALAWVAVYGGGAYAFAHRAGLGPRTALLAVFGVLTIFAGLSIAAAARRRSASCPRRAPSSSPG